MDTSKDSIIVDYAIPSGHLTISHNELLLGDTKLLLANITGIRYCVEKHFVNGLNAHRSFGVSLTDNSTTLQLEFADQLFSVITQYKDYERQYCRVLEVLQDLVVTRLVCEMLNKLQSGSGFQVGALRFDKNGIHTSSSSNPISSFWKNACKCFSSQSSQSSDDPSLLRWADVRGYSVRYGFLMLCREGTARQSRKRILPAWGGVSLQDDWNAVCLIPVLEALRDHGIVQQLAIVDEYNREVSGVS